MKTLRCEGFFVESALFLKRLRDTTKYVFIGCIEYNTTRLDTGSAARKNGSDSGIGLAHG